MRTLVNHPPARLSRMGALVFVALAVVSTVGCASQAHRATEHFTAEAGKFDYRCVDSEPSDSNVAQVVTCTGSQQERLVLTVFTSTGAAKAASSPAAENASALNLDQHWVIDGSDPETVRALATKTGGKDPDLFEIAD